MYLAYIWEMFYVRCEIITGHPSSYYVLRNVNDIYHPSFDNVQEYLFATSQCLFCHKLAYAITASGVCFQLLVPPLAQCCFLVFLA